MSECFLKCILSTHSDSERSEFDSCHGGTATSLGKAGDTRDLEYKIIRRSCVVCDTM